MHAFVVIALLTRAGLHILAHVSRDWLPLPPTHSGVFSARHLNNEPSGVGSCCHEDKIYIVLRSVERGLAA
jgi:hypothetical protein